MQSVLGGRGPGVDEIHPEYLISMDFQGMSWQIRLCNIVWWSGTVLLMWQTSGSFWDHRIVVERGIDRQIGAASVLLQ